MSSPCDQQLVEGIFALQKPSGISSGIVLQELQSIFASSATFAPLLKHAPKRTKDASAPFKMGHAGTLDPMASGVLIVGIGRGTKSLVNFLDGFKTYETVVLFGVETDSYDITGRVMCEAKDEGRSVTREMVETALERFRGHIKQVPPVVSALKVGGKKALELVEEGKTVELAAREVTVQECELLDWWQPGEHEYHWPSMNQEMEGDSVKERSSPAVRIRITVSSGFYVRSLAHDLGLACDSCATMASLHRSRQSEFTTEESPSDGLLTAIPYHDFKDETKWGPQIAAQLSQWMRDNPLGEGHVDGRDAGTRRRVADLKAARPRQRFRGEWVAETKAERKKQQGGKWKGKWGKKVREDGKKSEKFEAVGQEDGDVLVEHMAKTVGVEE